MKHEDVILVKNAVFYAYHGATPPQISQGQRFTIDAEVALDLTRACREDDITGAMDCAELYGILEEVTTRRRYNLMQSLALDIIREVKKRRPEVTRVTVGACKTSCVMYSDCKNVPGGGGFDDRLGVTLTRRFGPED